MERGRAVVWTSRLSWVDEVGSGGEVDVHGGGADGEARRNGLDGENMVCVDDLSKERWVLSLDV